MGKSSNKKKKSSSSSSSSSASPFDAPPRPDLDASVFLRRAHELKEEGNKRFQCKDYPGAMDQYEQALKLIAKGHPDRAVFHSNRAACLMQMKPVQYESVIAECSLALEAHPRFGRALCRRARAFEALGKLELALQDVQLLLQSDSNHQDALDLAKRLRDALGRRDEAQQDLQQGRPAAVTSPPVPYAGTSPAALGASVVRGSPVGGRGPVLPARPVTKKKGKPDLPPSVKALSEARPNGVSTAPVSPAEPRKTESSLQMLRVESVAKDRVPAKPAANIDTVPASVSESKETVQPNRMIENVDDTKRKKTLKLTTIQTRPLKLIYDHDIRLGQMPVHCRFRELRELVRKRFPSSKAVLIKYRDSEGDLVTITSTEELRLAEAAAAADAKSKSMQAVCSTSKDGENDSQVDYAMKSASSQSLPTVYEPLRLHVVEVSAEQEPIIPEDDNLMDETATADDVDQDLEESSNCSVEGEGLVDSVGEEHHSAEELVEDPQSLDPKAASPEKMEKAEDDQLNCKEIEIDEWLLDFAHLFRMHLGIDPDGHVDLHELGMELCSEALEETVTSEEAQQLFEMAACKFQEVAALAFFNWGNVHMCAARKRIPLEENGDKELLASRLQMAFSWAQGQYALAEQKYEEALRVKSDFYEGVLALGQEKFESAKLRWSVALASKVDLGTWDSSETLGLFDSAEEKMQTAAQMWEKLEEQRMNEAKAPLPAKREVSKVDLKGHSGVKQESAEAETAEQVALMRSQINLFWGNILFEHSQVEFRLGLVPWKPLLDAAVQKFELAGATPSDIAVVLRNHVSHSSSHIESAAKTEKGSLDNKRTHEHMGDVQKSHVSENGKELASSSTPLGSLNSKTHTGEGSHGIHTSLENGSVE